MSKASGAEDKVNTRRLKPVYDALDGAQPKKALQESEKVLKKQPNMPACRALKALSLIRLERSQEAFDVLSSLEKEMEVLSFDDNTYSAMCHAYREAYTPERIPRMYELLCSRNPQSEQYLTHLFMAYARIRDYKKQQQVAMNLFKEFQKPAYFFWGIMSVVMQAITDQKLGSTMFFPLAEKMIEKYLDNRLASIALNSKIYALNNDGELKTYLMILEGRGRYEDAIKLLEETQAEQLISHVDKKFCRTEHVVSPATDEWIFRRIVKYFKILNQHKRIFEQCEKRMISMKSDWFLIKTYNDALISLIKNGAELTKDKNSSIRAAFKSEIYILENFVHENLDEKTLSQDNIIRTKFLGRFELMTRLVNEGEVKREELHEFLDSYLQGNILEQFKSYCNYYYRNPSCFSDFSNYLLVLLSSEEQRLLIKYLEEKVQQNENTDCALIVLLERVKRLFGIHSQLNSTQRWELINSLFLDVLKSNERDICGAALVQLIGFLLWDAYRLENDFTAIYHLAVLLEFAAARYPGEQNIRVLATRVYGMLGAPTVVLGLTRQLDIKYIQRDTLGYLIFSLTEQYGLFRNAIVYYTSLSSMYDQHEREISECLVNAYKYSQYDQISKFIEFWEKSTDSIYAQAADTNNQYLAPSFAVDNLEIAIQTLKGDELDIRWEKLSDNRDLKSIFTVENAQYYAEVEKWKESSFVELRDMLKYRKLLCRCASLIGQGNTTYEEFSKKLVELRLLQENFQKIYVEDNPSKLIQAFTPFRFAHFMKTNYFELLDILFDSAAKLIALKDSRLGLHENGDVADEAKILEVLPAPDDVFDAISKFLPQITKESLKPLAIQNALFDLSEAVGVIMFSIVLIKLFELLICQICGKNPVVAGQKTTKKDKKKKDIDVPKEKKGDLVDRFEQMKPVYGEQLAKLDNSLEILKEFVESGEYLPIFETHPFNHEVFDEHQKEVHLRLRDSYLNSIGHLKDIIIKTQKRFFSRFADLQINTG